MTWKYVAEHLSMEVEILLFSIKSQCGFPTCGKRHLSAINPRVLLFYLLRSKGK